MHASARVITFAALGGIAAPGASAGPDLTAADISSVFHYGAEGGVHAYALGVTACNRGDEVVDWLASTPAHPATAMHMYRAKDGRLEQIGLSFAAHTVVPLQGDYCTACTPGDSQHLGIGCSNPNSPTTVGSQFYLGFRADINAATGSFPFPFDSGPGSSVIDRRLQVPASLLTDDGDETYYAEAQYVAADDAAASNATNNAATRPMTLGINGGFVLSGQTLAETPALLAWAQATPGVVVEAADVPGDGRLHVAASVVDLGDGTWRYHYMVHNLNSHRSASGITVPAPVAQVTDPGFHAPLYHSGSPVDNEAWDFAPGDASVSWFTDAHTSGNDASANAVRWGTTYTFSLTAPTPPTTADVIVHLFRPGAPGSLTVPLPTPSAVCVADLAEPFGQLDFSDVTAFLVAFAGSAPEADLAEPFGQWDFSDVIAYLAAFGAGCP